MSGVNQQAKTSSKPLVDIISRQMLPGILSSSFSDPPNLPWIRQIVDHGFELGLPMGDIYERKREVASNVRKIFIPSFSYLMNNTEGDEQEIPQENPMDHLFQ